MRRVFALFPIGTGVILFMGQMVLFCSPAFAGTPKPSNGLIGFWSGNNTAADSSPTGNNGSFGGRYVPGRPGGDAAFDISTGTVTVPNNSVYDSFSSYPGWTVGFWFNTNGISPNSSNDLFLGQDNGSGYQPKWFIDYGYTVFSPNNQFVWHVNDYNTERIFLVSQTVNPIPSGWNQLTVVVDNTARSVTFYLNGQSIGSDSLPSYVLETSAPLIFGSAEGFSYGGLMNDVAIYNRALSSQEVTDLVASTESSQTVFVANSGGSVTSEYLDGTNQSPATAGGGSGMAINATGNAWSINSDGSGISVFTDIGALSNSYSGAGINGANALAIDGNGTVWLTSSNSLTAMTVAGSAVVTKVVAAAGGISSPASIQVDTAGSLWIANTGNGTVTEVIGIAAPVVTPTMTAVTNKTLGTRP